LRFGAMLQKQPAECFPNLRTRWGRRTKSCLGWPYKPRLIGISSILPWEPHPRRQVAKIFPPLRRRSVNPREHLVRCVGRQRFRKNPISADQRGAGHVKPASILIASAQRTSTAARPAPWPARPCPQKSVLLEDPQGGRLYKKKKKMHGWPTALSPVEIKFEAGRYAVPLLGCDVGCGCWDQPVSDADPGPTEEKRSEVGSFRRTWRSRQSPGSWGAIIWTYGPCIWGALPRPPARFAFLPRRVGSSLKPFGRVAAKWGPFGAAMPRSPAQREG